MSEESNLNQQSVAQLPFRGRGRLCIKVCGVTLPAQLEAFDEMGVELAGFIFLSEVAAVYGE
jgi:hypothetical protein